MNFICGLLWSYLVGSIPTAYIMGRILKGIDIRDYGSGNVGATNAFRVLGKAPGTLVLIFDILKGAIAVIVIGNIYTPAFDNILSRILLGIAVVSGHNWTIFLKFKGGKGIATSLGVLIGLTIIFQELRPVLMICVLGWLAVFIFTGYVSLASIIAAVIMPLVSILSHQTKEMMILSGVFCLFVIIRHRSNIQRLLSGKESRVNFPFRKR